MWFNLPTNISDLWFYGKRSSTHIALVEDNNKVLVPRFSLGSVFIQFEDYIVAVVIYVGIGK